jgi:uncharacterized GH25 family protein
VTGDEHDRAAALLVIGGLVHADEGGSGHLEGQVVAEDGAPAAGAFVTVSSPELEDGDTTVTTDGAGRFALGPVRAGLYDVAVEVEGYNRGSLTTLRVQDGQTTRAEIVLQRRAQGQGY